MGNYIDEHSTEHVMRPSLRDAIGELASGAYVATEDDEWGFSYKLVKPVAQPDGDDFTVLIHRGWLEGCANGGSYKLSDAGLRAYLRSTDELGDGRLVHPHGWEN